MAFSPDGLWLASGGDDGRVCLWEPWSGKAVLRLPGHQGSVCSLAFAADGRSLLSGSSDTTALLWSLRPPAGRRQPEALWSDLAGSRLKNDLLARDRELVFLDRDVLGVHLLAVLVRLDQRPSAFGFLNIGVGRPFAPDLLVLFVDDLELK
ncbi:MAG: hypothetical protein HYS12_25745 [Planctomycetes bacterium]|nr:hypothetical protein [Planctomycetota bacterium]